MPNYIIIAKIKKWYDSKVIKKHCVVCKNYAGVDNDEEDAPTIYGTCNLDGKKHKYYDTCEDYKKKALSEFL